MSLNLQPRDHAIMDNLKKYGVLSTKQIRHWYFAGVAKTTVLRRIRLLEDGNYIKRAVTLSNGTNTWTLGFKGRKIMSAPPAVHFSNRNSIHHDVLLNDLRRKLELFGLAKDVTPEFELKSEVFRNHRYRNAKDQLIPNALMFEPMKKNPWVISLELELTIKSEARYKRIFLQYGMKDSITRIWYFCQSVNEINRLLVFAQRHYTTLQKRMWFSVVEDFLSLDDPKLWSGHLCKWLPLSEVNFDNFKMPAHPPDLGVSTATAGKTPQDIEGNLLPSQANQEKIKDKIRPLIAPDHSPPTMVESGQELWPEEKMKLNNNVMERDLKECG